MERSIAEIICDLTGHSYPYEPVRERAGYWAMLALPPLRAMRSAPKSLPAGNAGPSGFRRAPSGYAHLFSVNTPINRYFTHTRKFNERLGLGGVALPANVPLGLMRKLVTSGSQPSAPGVGT